MMEPPRYDDIYYPRTDKRMIKGNQYTYQGNKFKNMTNQGNSIEESISVIIQNQEYGPNSEYAHTLSRAKLFDMKGLKPPPKVKAY